MLPAALQLGLNVKISWWSACRKPQTKPSLSIARTFSLTRVKQPAIQSRMLLCCSSGFSCITTWECGNSPHLPLENQSGSVTPTASKPYLWPSSHPGSGLTQPFLAAALVSSTLSIYAAVTAVSHWWQDPKSRPGLWFQSYMSTCHMDNPAVTCLIDYRGLKLEVHMEIFFVCALVLPNVLV